MKQETKDRLKKIPVLARWVGVALTIAYVFKETGPCTALVLGLVAFALECVNANQRNIIAAQRKGLSLHEEQHNLNANFAKMIEDLIKDYRLLKKRTQAKKSNRQ